MNVKLQVIWSEWAENQLDDIYAYYLLNAGEVVAKRIVLKILEETLYLSAYPFIGQKEPLLAHRNENYRYLICGNHKIIYFVEEKNDIVKIIDIFDTRQNPLKMKI